MKENDNNTPFRYQYWIEQALKIWGMTMLVDLICGVWISVIGDDELTEIIPGYYIMMALIYMLMFDGTGLRSLIQRVMFFNCTRREAWVGLQVKMGLQILLHGFTIVVLFGVCQGVGLSVWFALLALGLSGMWSAMSNMLGIYNLFHKKTGQVFVGYLLVIILGLVCSGIMIGLFFSRSEIVSAVSVVIGVILLYVCRKYMWKEMKEMEVEMS